MRRIGWRVGAATVGAMLIVAGAMRSLSDSKGKAPAATADTLPETQAFAIPAPEPPVFPAPRAIDPSVFHLGIRKVVIDPGHGGSDPGAMTGEIVEKEVTLDIARRLGVLLRAAGFVVTLTRQSDDTLSLQQRVA
jgi:N-acetylmuramoyl-L-alanine amidase